MKERRDLSGIYYRVRRDDKWVNLCFEDLEPNEQKDILNKQDHEFARNMVLVLANTINKIGEELNVKGVR